GDDREADRLRPPPARRLPSPSAGPRLRPATGTTRPGARPIPRGPSRPRRPPLGPGRFPSLPAPELRRRRRPPPDGLQPTYHRFHPAARPSRLRRHRRDHLLGVPTVARVALR